MKFLSLFFVLGLALFGNSKLHVCYTKKIISESTGNVAYVGCKRYHDSCDSNGKLHFGKYPSSSKALSALNRCIDSSPKFVDSGKRKIQKKSSRKTQKSTTHRKSKKAMNADQVAAGLLFSGLKWLYGGGSHSSSSSSSTRTSGSKIFSCHYYCRTDGLLDNHTSTFNVNIYANSRYQAEDKLGDIAKKHCQNMKASGKWMWATSKRCD